MQAERKQRKQKKNAQRRKKLGNGVIDVDSSSSMHVSAASKTTDAKSKDIVLEDVSISYQSDVLLSGANITILHQRKYGLVAPNGTGKSTLLKHLYERKLPIPEYIEVLYVQQEAEASNLSALDIVLQSDKKRNHLLDMQSRLEKAIDNDDGDPLLIQEELEGVYADLRAVRAYSAENRASSILTGLSFTPEMQSRPSREFSGGWRMRISLAQALFLQPSLLLLDEPTNHLDLDAVIWLECYLRSYRNTLLLVSHDKNFLNNVVTDILEIKERCLYHYKGNYDAYERVKEQDNNRTSRASRRERQILKHAQEQQTERDRRFLKDKKKASGTQTKTTPYSPYKATFRFTNPPDIPDSIIEFRNASFSYPNNTIFENLELNVDAHARIAIVGPNGSGKSTLMNLMLGLARPEKGEILRNSKLRVVKFSQHSTEQLDLDSSPVRYILTRYPKLSEQEVRNKLGGFGIKGKALQDRNIGLLSGGQKNRIALLEVALGVPHVLFLDEPTNHLDMESIDSLIDALNAFKGGIVLISHNQQLISSVSKELWLCRGDASVSVYDGSFEDYKQELIEEMPDAWFD